MIRLKVLKKTTVFVLLLILSGSQVARAQTKLYQYDGKAPFVKMMLTMMEAMGILDKVPGRGAYGQYGYPASPWSGYGNNPFSRSPWLRSPWTQSAYGGGSPIWGSPDWGVLPTHRYSYNSYGPYGTQWSSTDLDGWVDEPWEASEWNPRAEAKPQSQPATQQQVQPQPAQPIIPIVQNFNYGPPETTQQNVGPGSNNAGKNVRANNRQNKGPQTGRQSNRPSPLAKLRQSPRQSSQQWQHSRPVGPPGGRAGQQFSRSMENSKRPNTKQTKKPRRYEKPCVTDFCGLKKPNLNGLWVAQDGEMLGVKNKRYLWSDGDSRYLSGQLKIENEYLLASVEGSNKVMRFKYKLAGNHLLTMQPDGKIREFVRTPNNRYDGQYPGYGYDQNYGQDYGAYTEQYINPYKKRYPGNYYP